MRCVSACCANLVMVAYTMRIIRSTGSAENMDAGGNPEGGEWVPILRYGTSPYTPSSSAVGDLSVDSGFAKLSDVAINRIRANDGYAYYRLSTTDYSQNVIYIRTNENTPFDDKSDSLGWIPGPYSICTQPQFERCTWHEGPSRFVDTADVTGNSCQRWFTKGGCIGVDPPARCFSRGWECGHNMIENVIIARYGREPAGSTPVEDTPGWQNNFDHPCEDYEFFGWCHNGDFTPGSEYMGSPDVGPGSGCGHQLNNEKTNCAMVYNYPADNCVVCGKGKA